MRNFALARSALLASLIPQLSFSGFDLCSHLAYLRAIFPCRGCSNLASTRQIRDRRKFAAPDLAPRGIVQIQFPSSLSLDKSGAILALRALRRGTPACFHPSRSTVGRVPRKPRPYSSRYLSQGSSAPCTPAKGTCPFGIPFFLFSGDTAVVAGGGPAATRGILRVALERRGGLCYNSEGSRMRNSGAKGRPTHAKIPYHRQNRRQGLQHHRLRSARNTSSAWRNSSTAR